MKSTSSATGNSQDVLSSLSDGMESLTPEMRKAAAYVLDNPNDVSVSSIREIAAVADVKPNTFVRLAHTLGFDGYEDCLLYTSPSPRDKRQSRMPSSA